MKSCIIIIFIFLSAVQTANAAKLISGSLDSLKNERKIAVSLDCSKCVYKVNSKELAFEYFLAQASRDDDWEQRSLDYFVENLNEKIINDGMIAFNSAQKHDLRYELIVTPLTITKNGNINAEIYIKDNLKAEIIATIFFKAEGDNNDRITLRDPLIDGGEDVGNLFRKLLKNVSIKTNAKQQSIDFQDDIYN